MDDELEKLRKKRLEELQQQTLSSDTLEEQEELKKEALDLAQKEINPDNQRNT